MEKRPGRGADQFILRLPEGMRDLIKEHAEKNARSMNAEIVIRLETAYSDANKSPSDITLHLSEDLREKLEAASTIYDHSAEEHAIWLIQRDVDRLAEYQTAYEEISELQFKNHVLESDLQKQAKLAESLVTVVSGMGVIGVGYSNLVISICNNILAYRETAPKELVAFAEKTLDELSFTDADWRNLASAVPEFR